MKAVTSPGVFGTSLEDEKMKYQRILQKSARRGALGLLALGAALPAGAANLLLNPGFEAPPDAGQVSTDVVGWTLVNDAARANFQNHTPGGTYMLWGKAWQSAGGGAFQDVAVTGGGSYSISSFMYFEAGYPATLSITQMGVTWLNSGGTPVGTPSFLNIDPTMTPVTTGSWQPFSFTATAPAGAVTGRYFLGWMGPSMDNGGAQSVFFDDAVLDGPGSPPVNSIWAVNKSGDWNIGGNWANGNVPNAAGAEADFFGALTASHTVFTDVPVTVGTMNFNNGSASYVIAGAGSLTLQGAGTSSANVIVQAGSHKLNLPVVVASDTTINVSGGATLTVGNPINIATGKTLTKNGTVLIQAPLTIGSGGAMVLNSGSTSLFGAPSLGSAAKIDVKTNSLTIDYHGQTTPAATISAQLTSGYAGGAFNGPGINSSSATNSLGVGWKDDTANQTIQIKYVYYGDANIDGKVDTLDFNSLAANFGGTGKVWSQADFNYDGKIDTLDFNKLAANFGQQLSEGAGALVPEPSICGLLGLASIGLISRRRRR
jgi:hypothetical protein